MSLNNTHVETIIPTMEITTFHTDEEPKVHIENYFDIVALKKRLVLTSMRFCCSLVQGYTSMSLNLSSQRSQIFFGETLSSWTTSHCVQNSKSHCDSFHEYHRKGNNMPSWRQHISWKLGIYSRLTQLKGSLQGKWWKSRKSKKYCVSPSMWKGQDMGKYSQQQCSPQS